MGWMLYFVAVFSVLLMAHEIKNEFDCQQNLQRYDRHTDSSSSFIAQALRSTTDVITNFNNFAETIVKAGKALHNFEPVLVKILHSFITSVTSLAFAIGKVAEVVLELKTLQNEPETKMVVKSGDIQKSPFGIVDAKQRDVLKRIFEETTNYEGFLNLTVDTDILFEILAKQRWGEIQNVSGVQFEKYQNLTREEISQYSMSLQQIHQLIDFSESALKQFETKYVLQTIQYELALKQLKKSLDVSNSDINEFLKLSEEKTELFLQSVQQLQKLRDLSRQQVKQIEELSNDLSEMSREKLDKVQLAMIKISYLSETRVNAYKKVAKKQMKKFKKMESYMNNYAHDEILNVEHLAESKVVSYVYMADELRDLTSFSHERMNELYALSSIVSDGFGVLQQRMDDRFDRIEKMIEMAHETTLFFHYESEVQRRLREVHDAYIHFVKSIINITTNNEKSLSALEYLKKQCCKNAPIEIMSIIFHKTARRTMHQKGLFEVIQDKYLTTNTARMMLLLEFVMDDVFKTVQMLMICDRVTRSSGVGFTLALGQSEAIIHTLNNIIGNIQKDVSFHLQEQSAVLNDIINKWISGDGNNTNTLEIRKDLGCHGTETDFGFALYAALQLEKRFHFLTFFVAVYRFNVRLVRFTMNRTMVSHSYNFKHHNMSYFMYKKAHSVQQHNRSLFYRSDSIMIVSVFTRKNQKVNTNCLSRIKLNCNKWHRTTDQDIRNGLVFYAQQHTYLCGNSKADFPFAVKFCNSHERPLLIAVCH